MNIKLENYFLNRFNKFFIEPLSKEVACSNGWFFLLNWLCEEIEKRVEQVNENKSEDEKISFEFLQIKEKFGKLRIYYKTEDEVISHYITMAESISGYICEETGLFDETIGFTTKGWQKTISKSQSGYGIGWKHCYYDDVISIWEEIRAKNE